MLEPKNIVNFGNSERYFTLESSFSEKCYFSFWESLIVQLLVCPPKIIPIALCIRYYKVPFKRSLWYLQKVTICATHLSCLQIDGENDRVLILWPVTIAHKIDQDSPLYDMNPRDILSSQFEVVLTLEGVTEETGNTIQVTYFSVQTTSLD